MPKIKYINLGKEIDIDWSMKRTFTIEGKIIQVNEEEIIEYYWITEDLYFLKDGVLSLYSSPCILTTTGKIYDMLDIYKIVPYQFYKQDGSTIKFDEGNLAIDNIKGFIIKDKFYILEFLEEIFPSEA